MAAAVAAIETSGLTKRFGRKLAVRDLSMKVRQGEVFGFMGANGAGKTTTIRLLLDLIRPTLGSASIFGLDCRRASVAVRRRLGNLPGDFSYDPRLTGRDLLTRLAGLRGLQELGRAPELAERFHADLDQPLGALSHGSRQKVGLIQALFHQPDLLLLDEPTLGLDPLMKEEFLALVREERAAGRTVLLSSHELDEVQRVCDRVAVIREGALVAVEDVGELRGAAARRISVRAGQLDCGVLTGLTGVSRLEADGNTINFLFSGDLSQLVHVLDGAELQDLEVSRPGLEELLLSYYGKDRRD